MSARPVPELPGRLAELARVRSDTADVVSVYLATRWADEQQRDRVRVFVKNELRRARDGGAGHPAPEDLDWIQEQAARLVEGATVPEASAVALFACRAAGLREVVPLTVALDNLFVVGPMPVLRPLVLALEERPATIVAFVDGESARLMPLRPDGQDGEVLLESPVEGRHSKGNWAALAQSRYQRHIEEHRGQHFDAVADVLTEMVSEYGAQRIVLAGESRTLATFRKSLSEPIAARVVGGVSASRYEPASAIRERAAELLARELEQESRQALASALTEAAKGGQATAGLESTLAAVNQGAVHQVWLLVGFQATGAVCTACDALQRPGPPACRFCGKPTRELELGEAIVDRVLASGGKVETLREDPGLAGTEGVAARLRYPLRAA